MAYNANYGIVFAPSSMQVIPAVDLAASVQFKSLGGKFMVNSAGNHSIADSGDTQIAGWAMVEGEYTSNSTAAIDKVPLCRDLSAIFAIAPDEAFTAASLKTIRHDTCDLIVSSNIQYADIGESTEDVIIIVGGDVAAQILFVQINPDKLHTAGVV